MSTARFNYKFVGLYTVYKHGVCPFQGYTHFRGIQKLKCSCGWDGGYVVPLFLCIARQLLIRDLEKLIDVVCESKPAYHVGGF